MRNSGIVRLEIGSVLLAAMLSAAGCATTPEEQKKREYRQQQAAERFSEALVDFIIESF